MNMSGHSAVICEGKWGHMPNNAFLISKKLKHLTTQHSSFYRRRHTGCLNAKILKKYCSERGYRPPTLDSDCRGSGLCKVPLRVRLKLTWHTYFTQKEATVRLFFFFKKAFVHNMSHNS